MCGITGIFSAEVNDDIIKVMTHTLAHRGPDATGIYINHNKSIALGHTRLSIIDLSNSANQPMETEDSRYVIVFNGEIYNYKKIREELIQLNPFWKFRTQSDTEVILHAFVAWGNNMLQKLEGMFALAIYDSIEHKIFLCRDRMGKKPLFYSLLPDCFIFASEIKALLRHPKIAFKNQINNQALYFFLHLGYIPEPFTVYSSILKFPAGQYGWVDAGFKMETNTYWNLNEYILPTGAMSQNDIIPALHNYVISAVEKRMVSDVPIGSFLSGGSDSALVTSIAARLSMEKLKTFTIGFKDQKFDESPYANSVAQYLNTEHHEYILTERDALESLEKYINHFDEPFADTSAIPTMLISSIASKEIKVALTGDGGDELFLGYGAYNWANRFGNSWFKILQQPMGYLLKYSGNSRLNRASHLLLNQKEFNRRSHIFSQEQYFFSQSELMKYVLLVAEKYSLFYYTDPVYSKNMTEAEKQALFDLNYYLKDDLLVKVDRASMYYGLECRNPLIDHQLIAFVMNIPYRFKKRRHKSKWILKEILSKYLPEQLINRPKWGFSVPLSKWMKNDLKFLFDNYLNKEIINDTGIVDFDYVVKLKNSFFHGNDYLYNRLWVLIVLHKWLREHAQ